MIYPIRVDGIMDHSFSFQCDSDKLSIARIEARIYDCLGHIYVLTISSL